MKLLMKLCRVEREPMCGEKYDGLSFKKKGLIIHRQISNFTKCVECRVLRIVQ